MEAQRVEKLRDSLIKLKAMQEDVSQTLVDALISKFGDSFIYDDDNPLHEFLEGEISYQQAVKSLKNYQG